MSAYVLQATKPACVFSLDNMRGHTAQRATCISCNRPVRLKAWLRLLSKFDVYTWQKKKIIIFVAGSHLYIYMDANLLFLLTQSNQLTVLSMSNISVVSNVTCYSQAGIAL